MWVNPLLQALIDAAQSEQTSRTIRIVCTILVSLLYLIGLACLFLLVFVIEGQGLFIRGFFLVMGIIVPCRLFAVFEGHREEEEEAVMKPDLEKTRAYYRNFSSENICDCDYCQNYCARVKAAYPEVARYLDSLGVDSKE